MTSRSIAIRFAGAALALAAVLSVAGVRAQTQAQKVPGLWLLPRKDSANTARADVPGRMKTAPREVWSYGGGRDVFSFCQPVRIGGKARYFGQVRSGLRLIEPNGRTLWQNSRLGVGSVMGIADFQGSSGLQALVTIGQDGKGLVGFALVDVADGKTLWTWNAPTGAYAGTCKLLVRPGDARLICLPQNTLTGLCFRWPGKDAAKRYTPEILWERTYLDAYWQAYGPQIVLADMDNDGKPEVVVAGKPGYAGVIDLDTGAMKYDVRYQVTDGPDIGRPYGLLTVEDLDGDGYRDIVMVSCQVEEYIGVVRNLAGKGLAPVWSQFVEKDYPEDHREIRPNIASIADIDGDGKKEIVVGLFNLTDDQKWHTVAYDAFGGWKARKLDLPGRYFWGCYDLDGDGIAEVITSTEPLRRTATSSEIQAVDGRTGRDRATVSSARLTIENGPLDNNTGFLAYRSTPVFVSGENRIGGLLLRRRTPTGREDGPEEIWRIADGKSTFVHFKAAAGGRALLLSQPHPNITGIDLAFLRTGGKTGPDAANPRIAIAHRQRELIVELSDGRVIGGQPDWRHPGRFLQSWTMPGINPNIWIGPAGERVVCTYGPNTDEIHVGQPGSANAKGLGAAVKTGLIHVALPHPFYINALTKSGATLIPFGDDVMQLFVGLRTGVHTLACALFDSNGKQLWLNPKTGPYPRSAAAARLEPGAPYSLIVNDHYEKTIYSLDGRPKLDLPYGTKRNGIMVSSPYCLPIVGPYGPGGETRLLFTPGLDTVQSLDAKGVIGMNRSFSTYEFEYCGSSVAALRPGLWDLGMINHDGILHCVDLQTGTSRWTYDLAAKAYVFNVSTVDIDGDGRDNFLVGLPDGRLLALDERDGKGFPLWSVTFDAGVRDAFAADIDGDGFAEVIVETDDGRVRILR